MCEAYECVRCYTSSVSSGGVTFMYAVLFLTEKKFNIFNDTSWEYRYVLFSFKFSSFPFALYIYYLLTLFHYTTIIINGKIYNCLLCSFTQSKLISFFFCSHDYQNVFLNIILRNKKQFVAHVNQRENSSLRYFNL